MSGLAFSSDPVAPGVIEVDVREQDLPHVAQADPLRRECLRQAGQRRRRAGIHQRDAAGAAENRRRDDVGTAEKIEVDVVDAARELMHEVRAIRPGRQGRVRWADSTAGLLKSR